MRPSCCAAPSSPVATPVTSAAPTGKRWATSGPGWPPPARPAIAATRCGRCASSAATRWIALGAPARESAGYLQQGLRIALSLGDRAAEADLLARLAILQSNRLRFTEAVGLGRRAVAAGRAARSDRALALGLDGLKTAHAYLGEVAPLTEVIDELEPLLRRLGDLRLLEWTVFESAIPAFAAARWDEAEHRMAEAVEVSRRGGLIGHDSWFLAHLGWLARLRGRFDLALTHGRAAAAQARLVPQAWFGPTADALLAGTMLDCGDADGAAAVLRDALDAAGPEGAEAYRLRCLAPLAEATGDPAVLAEAERLLDGIETPPGGAFLLGADAYLCVARARLQSGDPSRARAVLAPLLAAARRLEWIPVLVTAGLARRPTPRRRWPTAAPSRPPSRPEPSPSSTA